jgi:hypothetical protein
MTPGSAAPPGSGWRRIAWEGVGADLPPEWDIVALSPGHLVAGPGGAPALELKTSPGPQKPLSEARLLRRLVRQLDGPQRRRFRASPLPEEWALPPGEFSGTGFRWHSDRGQGRGAVLTCRRCGRTHLIQFLSPPGGTFPLIPRVLGRFGDHRDDGWREIRIFDLAAAVPPGFRTDACRFEPGRYDLAYSGPAGRLRLLRFGPADVLLRERDLEAFLSANRLVARTDQRRSAGRATDWTAPADGRGLPWRRNRHRRLRAAQCRRSNRVLAVAFEGRKPLAPELFDSIWSRYGNMGQEG